MKCAGIYTVFTLPDGLKYIFSTRRWCTISSQIVHPLLGGAKKEKEDGDNNDGDDDGSGDNDDNGGNDADDEDVYDEMEVRGRR